MKYYSVDEIEITEKTWVADYTANVTKMVEACGGRYLARTSKVEKIEGQRPVPKTFLLIEWPSRIVADAFYESQEYRPYREKRIAGSRNEFMLVAGEDIAHVARIPE